MGWYHAAKTQQVVADGAGRSRFGCRFLWSHQSGQVALSERALVRDNPACSSPVVSVPAPVFATPGRSRAFPLFPLFLLCCLRAC
jgi:hypothetical protein